mgnify:FL=1
MEMDGAAYQEVVRRARAHIECGTTENLAAAETELASLHHIFPKRLEYICAEVALMIARGEDGAKCRNILDCTTQEFYPMPALADVFELKSRTFPEGTPAWRQTRFAHDFYINSILPQEYFARLNERKAAFLMEPLNANLMRALAEEYYVTRNMLAYFVLMMAYCRLTGREDYDDILIEDTGIPYPDPVYRGNFGFLLRMFTDGNSNLFLLVGTAEERSDQQVLARALDILGQQAMLVCETTATEQAENLNAYALHCIQGARADGEQIVLDVGRYRHEDGKEESATHSVIRLLARSTAQTAPLIVIARDDHMDELHAKDALAGDIQRLSHCLPPQFSYGFSFAWAGDYLTYISCFYGENIEPLLDAPATCDFSIVIPVRNSADTLRYTLETCLSVDYDGSYEIVLSDNSDEDRNEVYHLVEELNDPRIRYYKTPFVLPLAKSFEYAYLHARGAFIFSLGADDGVLPWALKYIRKAMEDYPSASVISWHRDYYLWPALTGTSVHKIQLVEREVSKQYMVYSLRGEHEGIIANIKSLLYRIPLLYINAGFRRGYLRDILRQTSRILDGGCQDLYMGTVNLLLQETCVEIQYPLTIAGMSGHSIGAAMTCDFSHVGEVPPAAAYLPLRARRGEYVPRRSEMVIPYILTADTFVFYMSLYRLREFGLPMKFHPEQCYTDLSDHIFLTDLRFDRYWGLLLYGSTLCSKSVHNQCLRFYEKICNRMKQIEDHEATDIDIKKGYSKGNQMITLDSTELDCHNIADAVRFEVRILNL